MGQSYSFGAFRLDAKERALFLRGELVPLTPKAVETLIFLVERHGHIVDKRHLMDAVWPGTFVEEVSLARNVSVLRKVFRNGGDGQSYIETIPKRGYRFVAPVGDHLGDGNNQQVQGEFQTSPVHEVGLPSKAGKWVRWSLLSLTVLVGIAAVWYLWRDTPRLLGSRRIMLAVLPVQNLTGRADREYVSDGLTEELIAQLGGMDPEHLGVIARTSSMSYKNTSKTAGQIGRELKVDYLLEVSLRESGESLRVTSLLIRTRDQTQLWVENYNRSLGDLLILESEVAREVASQTRLTLTPQQQARFAELRPVNPQAYDAYLKGRFFWNKRTPEAMTSAQKYFQQAIERDPNYAPGYAGSADGYQIMVNLGQLKASDGFPLARAAALKALELDNKLAEAHVSLASIKGDFDWDWQGAETEYKLALELNPNYATAHHWYAEFLAGMGRFNDATVEIKKAQEVDPLSPVIGVTLGQMYCRMGQCAQGIEQLKKTLEIYPDFDEAHEALAEIYAYLGMYQQSLVELHREQQMPASHSDILLGFASARAGHKQEALSFLEQFEKHADPQHKDYCAAIIYAALGDSEQACSRLENAFRIHDVWMPYLQADIKLANVRSDPCYQNLLHRMNLPHDMH